MTRRIDYFFRHGDDGACTYLIRGIDHRVVLHKQFDCGQISTTGGKMQRGPIVVVLNVQIALVLGNQIGDRIRSVWFGPFEQLELALTNWSREIWLARDSGNTEWSHTLPNNNKFSLTFRFSWQTAMFELKKASPDKFIIYAIFLHANWIIRIHGNKQRVFLDLLKKVVAQGGLLNLMSHSHSPSTFKPKSK